MDSNHIEYLSNVIHYLNHSMKCLSYKFICIYNEYICCDIMFVNVRYTSLKIQNCYNLIINQRKHNVDITKEFQWLSIVKGNENRFILENDNMQQKRIHKYV